MPAIETSRVTFTSRRDPNGRAYIDVHVLDSGASTLQETAVSFVLRSGNLGDVVDELAELMNKSIYQLSLTHNVRGRYKMEQIVGCVEGAGALYHEDKCVKADIHYKIREIQELRLDPADQPCLAEGSKYLDGSIQGIPRMAHLMLAGYDAFELRMEDGRKLKVRLKADNGLDIEGAFYI